MDGYGCGENGDVGVGKGGFDEGVAGAEVVVSGEQVDFAVVGSEVEGVFEGGVAAADDGDYLAAEFAGVGHGGLADVGCVTDVFAGDVEASVVGAGGEYDDLGLYGSVFVMLEMQGVDLGVGVDGDAFDALVERGGNVAVEEMIFEVCDECRAVRVVVWWEVFEGVVDAVERTADAVGI